MEKLQKSEIKNQKSKINNRKSKQIINKKFKPDGFNIGINIGSSAGQTVDHVHIHLIPRYIGDVKNPEGGVRNVIPSKAKYLKKS